MLLALVFRIAIPFFAPDAYTSCLFISALCWLGTFSIIGYRYIPMLLNPRIDGKVHWFIDATNLAIAVTPTKWPSSSSSQGEGHINQERGRTITPNKAFVRTGAPFKRVSSADIAL